MCRIFFNPSKTSVFNANSLNKFFVSLENSGGGDGNGIFSFKQKMLLRSEKNMPYLEKPEGMFLFHTRKATNGNVKEYNCQPFVGKRYIMVHNGVFSLIESYARLLGFPFSFNKYSDSYAMHWILEKIGILNFYNTFKDKSFGIVLVYDNDLEQMYLLKGSGNFTHAQLTSTKKYIYGTEGLDFWETKDKPLSFSSGLYRLNDTSFTIICKTATIKYTGQYQSVGDQNYYGRSKRWWDGKNDNDICAYCGDWFTIYETIFQLDNFSVCEICYKKYKAEKSEVPEECVGCNWLGDGVCWFGGLERNKFATITDITKKKTICNTKDDILAIVSTCDTCGKSLKCKDNWGMSKGIILCKKCMDKIERIKILKKIDNKKPLICCDTCHFFTDQMGIEPCLSCINEETGEFEHWTKTGGDIGKTKKLPKDDRDCENCKYQKFSQDDEPCLSCANFEREYYTKWEEKLGILGQKGFEVAYKLSAERKLTSQYEEIKTTSQKVKEILDAGFGKCWYCGYHFEHEEQPLNDKKGHLVCYECVEQNELDAYGV